jgi:hypothetical protein
LNQEKKAQKMLINKAFLGKGLAEKTRRKRGVIGRGCGTMLCSKHALKTKE